ncbi:hypothetical protein BAE44_0003190 [Dichanthelium oligosanthes]|uniref:Uncharacterized protein n=1 Tax=Dichanthelium oligosanthes TaxID=888268 RepID=A0A1E5WEG3_9POAL|nr:hypothetical protein BAE44_0003190 [Dichanthelium oligosanthes]
MENIRYAEELVREFLVFRGFTSTLQAYESELSTEIGRNFQVDKILDLVFSDYIAKYQLDRLVGLFTFFKQCFTSPVDTELFSTLVKLELSVLRYYVINALKSGRQDKVVEFFGESGNYLMQKREDWLAWFALLKISTEKNTIKSLKNDIKQLNNKLAELQASLEAKEDELSQLRRSYNGAGYGNKNLVGTSTAGAPLEQEMSENYEESSASSSMIQGVESQSSCSVKYSTRGGKFHESSEISHTEDEQVLATEEDFPEVKVDFQETFLGHNSSISQCRFSASGLNIASSSIDGTVRHGSTIFERTGFANLTVWHMKTWKPLIFEWSLHNQGQILWSRDCSRFCNPESFNKRMHEIALDSNGKRLLVTSGLVRAPIYQVQGHESGLRTLPHSSSITSVDWHPTLPMYITGSADHSVRVTSIL